MISTLFLSPALPSSCGVGVEKRASSHLEALLRIGEVDLILLMTQEQIDRNPVPPDLLARCRRVEVMEVASARSMRVYRTPGLTTLLRLTTYGRPRRVVREHAAAQHLANLLSGGDHSLVLCFRLSSYALLESVSSLPLAPPKQLAVDFDDIESNVTARLLRQPDRQRGIEQTLLLKLDRAETLRLEQRALMRASLVSVCSGTDAHALEARGPRASIRVQPNSFVALDALPPRPPAPPLRLLFIGTMTYGPNEDAAIYFCEKILPLVRQPLDGAVRLAIVGKGPSARVCTLAKEDLVHVTGGVPEVEPYYAEADVVVVPIRYGGGTRIKILEALALGRPVVSTTIGAEGLDLRNEEDILLADTPHDFAHHCVALAHDPARRASLAASGRARFMKLYEAASVESKWADELHELCIKSMSRP